MLPYLKTIIDSGAQIYQVGGTVRDSLLGLPSKDQDLLVTHLKMEELSKILKGLGKIVVVGRSFGILKFYPKQSDECIDIALPRKEYSTGTGHKDFQVDFDPELPIEDDLGRRDFTINAMAKNILSGEIIDPFGGKKDLENKILRLVFPDAFKEDPLRLLRAIQFTARFNFTLSEETEKAMVESAELIKTISAERIIEEIRKLFLSEKPSVGFKLMLKTGLLKYVFPELDECVGVKQGNKLKGDDVFLHTLRVLDAATKDEKNPGSGDLELMFAALFHDIGKPRTRKYTEEKQRYTFYGHQTVGKRMAKYRMKAWKISTIGIDMKRVASLVDNHMFQTKSFFTPRAIRRFISKIGEDLILKLVDLRIADNRGGKYPEGIHGVLRLRKKIEEELKRKPALRVGDLEITGHELMDMGVPEGPQIGSIQRALVQIVLDNPEKNSKEALTDIVKNQLL